VGVGALSLLFVGWLVGMGSLKFLNFASDGERRNQEFYASKRKQNRVVLP
jgi:hypothetical protein